MKNLGERFYYSAPLWVQHMLVTLYGISLRLQRYNKRAKAHLQRLLANETMDSEAIRLVQETLFVTMARDAIAHVPYYSDWAAKQGVEAKDIKGLEHIVLFPLLDKETVRQNPQLFFNKRILAQQKTFEMSTSGTTGSPLVVLSDPDSRTLHYAFWSRIRAWFGLPPLSRRATLFGRIIMLPEENSPPFWRYDLAQKNLLFSSYHLSERNLGDYIAKLKHYRPDELIGYPSSLYQLAHYIVHNGLIGQVIPKVVFSTAEHLLEYQRHLISEAFRCPVINQYGCTEMVIFASECEHGSLHIHPEHGLFEILDVSNIDDSEVVDGEAVCTGLVNAAMPLIRYRIGDQICLNRCKTCPCGREFLMIESIEGRRDDLIKTPDGRQVGRMDPVFKGFSGIKECQIIQYSLNKLIINIVCDEAYNDQIESALLHEFRKRLGDEMVLKLVKMEEIPRTFNGKFRAVISHVTQQQETLK